MNTSRLLPCPSDMMAHHRNPAHRSQGNGALLGPKPKLQRARTERTRRETRRYECALPLFVERFFSYRTRFFFAHLDNPVADAYDPFTMLRVKGCDRKRSPSESRSVSFWFYFDTDFPGLG